MRLCFDCQFAYYTCTFTQVIPISGMRVRAATQTLLVGSPGPLWVEAGGLGAAALGALQPPPRVSWALRDPAAARLYTTHADGNTRDRIPILY